jgi:aminoglycoside 6'-N-acetyltransferase I
MTVRIRAITPIDAETWSELRGDLWPGDDHRPEVDAFFRGELPEPLEVLVAEGDAGTIVGFVELSIRSEVPGTSSKRVGFIEGLYVVPSSRGTGVTRVLLASSREWAHLRGCEAFASDRADRFIVDPRFRKNGGSLPE